MVRYCTIIILNSNKMGQGYKLFRHEHHVRVKYSYLLKLLDKEISDILEEISWVAGHKNSQIINQPWRNVFIISGQTDEDALEVLLAYLEMQLLL